MRAEPRCQLNGASKKIVMVLDWLPRGSANSNFERAFPAIFFVAGKFVLNLRCAFNCCCRRQEGSHNAVTGVLDDPAAMLADFRL